MALNREIAWNVRGFGILKPEHLDGLGPDWLGTRAPGGIRGCIHEQLAPGLNPSFEADRVVMTQPAGWTTSTTTGGTPYTNVSGGHTGRWKWRLTDAAAYQATIVQSVTGLPNGTYRLSAWVKSSGGQSLARLFARNRDGEDQAASVNSAIPDWTQIAISGISVTNGACDIGLETTASANQWADLDDVSRVKISN